MPSALTAARRVLRLTFEPDDTTQPRWDDDLLIDFVGYARDSRLAGRLHLDAHRLTDLLNASDELDLIDVVCLRLDGQLIDADHAVVPRAELVAVKAAEPRGKPSLRSPTRQAPVVAGAGRYVMHGYIHGRPGADPMVHLGRRPPMVPLTDATIAYETLDGWRREEASTLIVNRDSTDWIRPAREDDLARLVPHRSMG